MAKTDTVKVSVKEMSESELVDKFNKMREHLANPETSMTDDKLADLKAKVSESLEIDRSWLLTRYPFTGGMLMRFTLIPIRDYRCMTAMTDGSRIFFDISFYKSLSQSERIAVLAHEIWHCIYLHFLRKGDRERTLWNVATDCEINYMLKGEGLSLPENLCFPPSGYEGKNAEEIYEYYARKLKKAMKNASSGSQQKSGGKGESGNGTSGSGSDADEEDVSGKRSGKKTGKFEGQFDEHAGGGKGDEEGDEMSLPSDEWGEKGEDKDYHPMIDSDVAERIREGVISTAQRVERTMGHLPGGIHNIIKRLQTPEVDWRERLSNFVTKCLGDRRVWLPPSRRHVWHETYLQSRRGEKIKVVCTIDTSGSTTADLPKFMTELVSLLNTFGKYELTLIQCDADVQSVESYDQSSPFPVEDCSKITWKGFGGSDLRPAFKYITENDIGASVHIVFTDGYITTPESNPLGCPTLFVLTSDGDDNLCSWGEKMRFKERRMSED